MSLSTPSSDTSDNGFPENDILVSNSTRYLIMDSNGEGSFGQVLKCLNLTTCNTEAVKVHLHDTDDINQREVEMLEAIKALDPDKNNIVRFMESFRFNSLSCLAFEMLDKSLFDLMKERKSTPLSLNEIRPVIYQLLVAFDALKDIGVLHADLKPDNVMLVNHKYQPYKVKLIDFGLACPVSQLKAGMAMQARSYRAPEVILGLPLSEAADMWGVGCVMAFLYFGMNLFPGNCEYYRMKMMVQLLGQPEDHLLSAGIGSLKYFSKEEGSGSPGWRLKSPAEYLMAEGVVPIVSQRFSGKNLEDAVQGYSKNASQRYALEPEDLMAFSSFLKSCLHLDPSKRITPKQALKHPFFTMNHLENEKDTNSYAGEAHQLMAVCCMQDPEGAGDSLIHSKTDMESDPRAFKTDLQRDSSSASVCENDSSSESFSVDDADIESFSDEYSDMDSYTGRHLGTRCSGGNDADIESFSDESSDMDSYTGRHSGTRCSGGNDADIESYTGRHSGTRCSGGNDAKLESLSDIFSDMDSYTGRHLGTRCSGGNNAKLESLSDIASDMDSYTGRHLGTRCSGGNNTKLESLSDISSDMDSYTGQHLGTRCSSRNNANIESGPATMDAYERDVFIKTQRDPSPASLWEEDSFTEHFSGRNEATDTRDSVTGSHNINNSEADNIEPSWTFQVQKNSILVSNSTSYLVMDLIGEGCFGKVAKCLNLTTNESVAVKIHTEDDEDFNQNEVHMLEEIRALDPEKNNIIRFLESFRFNNLSCLAFEMLDRSLFDLMVERYKNPFRLNEIRPVIHQLLVAFDALKGIGMLHTDLKPDNIMLVNHKDQPYRVKLIDFGVACPVNALEVGEIVQPFGFRAPEVMLGLPLSEAIDMWGVGCVMACLCFGQPLSHKECPYDLMKTMVQLLGQPEDHLLSAGIYSLQYFSRVEGSGSPGWRLKSPKEYEKATGLQPQLSCYFSDMFTDLEDAVHKCQPSRDLHTLGNGDTMAFLSLLKSCLHLDPSKRITPKQALKHPFITMTHLVNEKDTNSYAGEAHQLMAVCSICHSDEPGDPLTCIRTDMELRHDQPCDFSDGLDTLLQLPFDHLVLKMSGREKSRFCFRTPVESAAEFESEHGFQCPHPPGCPSPFQHGE